MADQNYEEQSKQDEPIGYLRRVRAGRQSQCLARSRPRLTYRNFLPFPFSRSFMPSTLMECEVYTKEFTSSEPIDYSI